MTVFVHIAKGSEEIEAVAVIDILRRAGLTVKVVSVMKEKEIIGAWDTNIVADLLFDEVDYSQGDMIILPGGGEGTENLAEHEGLSNEIQKYYNQGKWLAAICAAPAVFGKAGVLEGKAATCYPGFEKDLIGAEVKGDRIVVDNRIITGKGPGVAFEFSLKIVEVLKGMDVANKLKEEMFINS